MVEKEEKGREKFVARRIKIDVTAPGIKRPILFLSGDKPTVVYQMINKYFWIYQVRETRRAIGSVHFVTTDFNPLR